MIDILPQIAHNYIAQAAFWGWFTAQAIKFVWQLLRHGKFRPERLVDLVVFQVHIHHL